MKFLRDWVGAMPNTIIGLCTVGIIAVLMGMASLFTETNTLALAAMLFGQVGTVFALVIGFILDKRRINS